METITLCIRRGGATKLQQLTLRGDRLLGGHANTGIFRLVENESPRVAAQPTKPARTTRRDGDDGLSTATIEITEPLAFAEQARHEDPYNRGEKSPPARSA